MKLQCRALARGPWRGSVHSEYRLARDEATLRTPQPYTVDRDPWRMHNARSVGALACAGMGVEGCHLDHRLLGAARSSSRRHAVLSRNHPARDPRSGGSRRLLRAHLPGGLTRTDLVLEETPPVFLTAGYGDRAISPKARRVLSQVQAGGVLAELHMYAALDMASASATRTHRRWAWIARFHSGWRTVNFSPPSQ